MNAYSEEKYRSPNHYDRLVRRDSRMPGPVFLQGEQIDLHTIDEHDYDFIHRQWNDSSIRRGTNRQRPQSKSDIADFIQGDGIHFLSCRDEKPVGLVWLFGIDRTAQRCELGYWITSAERGNGYTTEAAELATTYAFEELGLNKVFARVFDGNDGSIRILENIGFTREGTLRNHYWVNGEFVDAHLYGILESDR